MLQNAAVAMATVSQSCVLYSLAPSTTCGMIWHSSPESRCLLMWLYCQAQQSAIHWRRQRRNNIVDSCSNHIYIIISSDATILRVGAQYCDGASRKIFVPNLRGTTENKVLKSTIVVRNWCLKVFVNIRGWVLGILTADWYGDAEVENMIMFIIDNLMNY